MSLSFVVSRMRTDGDEEDEINRCQVIFLKDLLDAGNNLRPPYRLSQPPERSFIETHV